MNKNIIISSLIFIFIVCFNFSYAHADEKQILRNKYESIHQQRQAQEPVHRNARSQDNWPDTHPASAATEVFYWFDEKFNIYLWRDDHNTPWVEIGPIGPSAFICSPSFDIFQNKEFHSVEDVLSVVSLEEPNGESFCDDVLEKKILKLTIWSSLDGKVDIDQAFDLYFSSNGFGSRDLSISFKENTLPPPPPPTLGGNLRISNKFFEFAENTYPEFFSPSGAETFEIDYDSKHFFVRYYAGSDTYLGTAGQDVYIYGEVFGGLLQVGLISDFIQIDPIRAVSTNITLPDSSPLNLAAIQVDMYNDSYSFDTAGNTQITLPEEFSADTTVMLPAREQDPYPVVYLFTTILPGEVDIQINAEETAISLLMNTITKDLLAKTGSPEEVKEIIRQNGEAFINKFKTMLENDPYTLALDNLDNVYDQTYMDAADSCRNALEHASLTPMPRAIFDTKKQLPGSLLNVSQNQLQYDFSVYENTVGSLGFFLWKFPDFDFENATGKVDGKLIIENDTMLFSYYKVTDLLTGKVLQDYPKTRQTNTALAVLDLMADKNIIGPQKDWMHVWWASTAKYDAYYQPVKIEIATPSLTSNDDAMLHNALAFRTTFALFTNLLAQIIPPDIGEFGGQGGKHLAIAKYLLESGAMDIALNQISQGEYKAAIEEVFSKLTEKTVMDKVWGKILNDQGSHLADKTVQKMLGRYYTKLGKFAKKFPITKIGLGIDIASLLNDYATIPGNIYFDKIYFPFYIDNMGPKPLPKVGKDEDLPRITMTGMGLGSVLFDNELYSPAITIEAKDIDGKNKIISIDEESIHPQNGGSELWFELPKEWAEIGSPIVGPLYISVKHYFIDPHGVDELITLELPDGANSSIEAAHKELMKIDFNSAISISSFNKEKVTNGEAVNIYGQGFATRYNDNHVYFTDHTGNTVKASLKWGNDKYLETTIPDGLEIGPLTVEVKLYDKPEFTSNSLTIPFIPKLVTADPSNATNDVNFEDNITVSLMQKEGYDIFYSIDDASIQPYSGAITLTTTAKIYPFARVVVDGVDYDSITSGYLYYKCAEGEEFVDGSCAPPFPPVDSFCPTTYNSLMIDFTYYNNIVNIVEINNDGIYIAPDDRYDIGDKVVCKYIYDDKLYYETPYVNYKKNGIEYEYYKSGGLKTETPFVDDGIQGIKKMYYESGQLFSEDSYIDNIRNGESKSFSLEGDMFACWLFVNGENTGDCMP